MNIRKKFKNLCMYILGLILVVLFIPIMILVIFAMIVCAVIAFIYNIIMAFISLFTKKELPFVKFNKDEEDTEYEEENGNVQETEKSS